MTPPISRRTVLKSVALGAAVAALPVAAQEAAARHAPPSSVVGRMTGAGALVEALITEETACVFGIPGAQENELWDEMKRRRLDYLLVTHEFSAACMADGYARSTGKPGVLCVVPGPGLTNSLTGLGEALLDSVPVVCIVGDVANGEKYRPFQVHSLPQAQLLAPVTKHVFEVAAAADIPAAIRAAFCLARSGEPGPVGVVVPYNLLIDSEKFDCPPPAAPAVAFDETAFRAAVALLSDRRLRVGLYVGQGCLDYSADLVRVAELLQAPVATSVSGKGAVDECHPLAVGWGYGPQGTLAAEHAFKSVDLVLAVGVRFSEVSTAFYSIPRHRHLIHVDANADNLGRIVKADVCVHADAGVFLAKLLEQADCIGRKPNAELPERIRKAKQEDLKEFSKNYGRCGIDPAALVLALRRAACVDALVFVDVTMTEHWAAAAFTVRQPRTYFNPTDNQAMGWSIPASLGAQRAHPGRQVLTLTGDGCFLMSMVEISTAAREGLPVKFFILDDQAYHYMQALQKQAYRRTTATILARLDYAALAKGFGVDCLEITAADDLDAAVQWALSHPGPLLVRVAVDYGERPCRWIDAAKGRFTKELSTGQKARFLARIGSRALNHHPEND
jgi:acetolactate synthase-1/2/3 large subunit